MAAMAALTVPLFLPPPSATAQTAHQHVIEEFEAIARTVVRIRTVADLEFERRDKRTGEPVVATRPYSVEGTGVVVGEMVVDGNVEYLVLTNHHVADASNYVREDGGYLRMNPANTLAVPSVHEESFLMKTSDGSSEREGIKLIELVRRVRGDMTLMRTVAATRALPTFTGLIGYQEGEIVRGAPVVTSGYPFGGNQIVAVGSIVEIGHLHDLGMPHEDFVLDMRVEPGQSGSPVFLVEEAKGAGGPLTFRLIALVHARDPQRDYAVPYSLWEESLEEFPEELRVRMVR